ncbi:MAG: RNA 2',3'-cyclic phosphodiesterase [Leptonema sp. (in: bacteria)]
MKKRTFLAITIPEPILDELEVCQRGIPNAKWIQRNNLHITLHFFGEIQLTEFNEIREILKNVKQKKFSIQLKNPKVFNKKYQKILWLSIEPIKPIQTLRSSILKEIQKRNFLIKKEEFIPHLTLARFNRIHQKVLNEYLLTFENFFTAKFEIDSFTLFSSILYPEGPKYTPEEIYFLNT